VLKTLEALLPEPRQRNLASEKIYLGHVQIMGSLTSVEKGL
jgi:hypothetical protein